MARAAAPLLALLLVAADPASARISGVAAVIDGETRSRWPGTPRWCARRLRNCELSLPWFAILSRAGNLRGAAGFLDPGGVVWGGSSVFRRPGRRPTPPSVEQPDRRT